MISILARFFRGLNMAMGVTTLAEDASPAKERNFVLAWVGISVVIAACLAAMVFWFLS